MIERIKSLIEYKGITASKFADELGVQRSGISHILSGRNKPSLELILKILDTYPEINTEWLLKGGGKMLTMENDLFSVVETNSRERRTEKRETETAGNSIKKEAAVSDSYNNSDNNSEVEKIIILYKDKSFRIYDSFH